MGYRTCYELRAQPWPDGLGEIIAADRGEMGAALEPDGSSSEDANWYGHEIDLAALSLRFPGVLFTLRGEGEEAGDIWYKYFLDGKVQVCRAIVTFPPFDATRLADPAVDDHDQHGEDEEEESSG
jgi:hypothetical protein